VNYLKVVAAIFARFDEFAAAPTLADKVKVALSAARDVAGLTPTPLDDQALRVVDLVGEDVFVGLIVRVLRKAGFEEGGVYVYGAAAESDIEAECKAAAGEAGIDPGTLLLIFQAVRLVFDLFRKRKAA
jgi:hypothetical protein